MYNAIRTSLKYIEGAKEVEFDGVGQNGELLNYAIAEHVENAGVHSGDATHILPAQKLFVETIRRVKGISQKVWGAQQGHPYGKAGRA